MSEESLNRLDENLTELLDSIKDMMLDRHKKYGPGNISKHGIPGILVRLDDKLSRLEHSSADYKDESYEDCFMDVVGYGLIAILVNRNQWSDGQIL